MSTNDTLILADYTSVSTLAFPSKQWFTARKLFREAEHKNVTKSQGNLLDYVEQKQMQTQV